MTNDKRSQAHTRARARAWSQPVAPAVPPSSEKTFGEGCRVRVMVHGTTAIVPDSRWRSRRWGARRRTTGPRGAAETDLSPSPSRLCSPRSRPRSPTPRRLRRGRTPVGIEINADDNVGLFIKSNNRGNRETYVDKWTGRSGGERETCAFCARFLSADILPFSLSPTPRSRHLQREARLPAPLPFFFLFPTPFPPCSHRFPSAISMSNLTFSTTTSSVPSPPCP